MLFRSFDKEKGSSATLQLAKDILGKLEENKKVKEEIEKIKKTKKTEEKKEGKEGKEEADDDKYEIHTIKIKEEDIYCVTPPPLATKAKKTGVNLDVTLSPVTIPHWSLTDPNDFIVVDYKRKTCNIPSYLSQRYPFERLDYETRVKSKVVTQENFAQQVRRLIQIRSKVQRTYGVKKGKLDQSRLSRISINAPGISERIFKNKIENNTLDVAVSVLVDMSFSMSGDKLYNSMLSAVLMNEVCSTLDVPLEILGFSDGLNSAIGFVPVMFIYKAFCDLRISTEELEKSLGISSSFMAGNPDGECILWAYDRLLRRREKRKILIVMSDGSPAASKGAHGISSFTRKAINEIEQAKLATIYGLGICSTSVEGYYTRNSVIGRPDQIPIGILKLLEREVFSGKNSI